MAFWSKDDDLGPVKTRKGFGKDPEKARDLKSRHARALAGFKLSASFFSKQRQREMEDLRFIDFNEQWDPTVKTVKAGNQTVSGMPPTPPQPMITINQLRGPCQQIANTRRAARIALEFAPKGAGSSDDLAEVFEDIVRAAQAESRASIARNWAADRSEKAGLGWYRIDTCYSPDAKFDDASWNDQDLEWCRILNQASVYPDPYAQEPDFSDGRKWYVTEDIPWEVYKDRYPDSDLASFSDAELTAIGDPNWYFTSAGNTENPDSDVSKVVRIAEVWEVVETVRTLAMLDDGTSAYEDDIPKGRTKHPSGRTRPHRERVIYWSKINGVEYLEEPTACDYDYVPLIPTIGEESNVNGERRWQGIVRPGKESAVSYNVMRSAQVTAIATASKAPYIGFARVIGKFMDWWQQSAVRYFPILPVEEVYGKDGQLLPMPQRLPAQIDISAMTIAAQAAKDDVHTTTGVPPAALGALDPHDRSGKAIQALQAQSEVGTSGYMDNFVNITMAYEGKVVRNWLPKIFDRPGRIVPAVGVDEKRRLVMLNQPYTSDESGMPVPIPNWTEGQSVPKVLPGPVGPDGKPTELEVKYYNLKDGAFSVMPTIGKSYNTRREEAADAIGNVMKAVPPEMAMAMAPAWLEEQDYPGARRLAEIAKKALPPQLASAYDDGKGPSPEVQQLQQQVQQLQQALQGKQAEAQAKAMVDLQKTQLQERAETQRHVMSEAGEDRRAAADREVKLAVAELGAKVDRITLFLEERARLGTQQHEHVQNALDRDHELRMANVEHQQAMQQAEQGQQHALEQGDQAGQQASEQMQQQAALQPPSEGA